MTYECSGSRRSDQCFKWSYGRCSMEKLGIDQVYKAGNAAEAKRILRACTVDILLSDIEMPGESGLQLLEWVRNEQMDIACIFLTAHADLVMQNSYEAGQCGLYPSASLLHTDRGIDPKSN